MLEIAQKKEPEEEVQISKKEIHRLLDVFKDKKVNNVEGISFKTSRGGYGYDPDRVQRRTAYPQ